ncbi:MAG: hypothetical protein JST00_10115 [Deltaproteobacteria bacterium]|nr:hypothetical protein [Deltaproteobacteria bacterium]
MADPIELMALDRDVRLASSRVESRRAVLAKGAPEDRSEPFGELRHTTTQSTYRALVEAKPAAHEVAHRDALLRWVHELLQARVAHELVLDEADVVHAIDPRLSKRAQKGASDAPERPMETTPRTYVEAWRSLLLAEDPMRAAAALERLADLALAVGAVRKEQRARRFEAARRLGLAHPWSLATGADFLGLARGLLDATEAIAQELQKDAQRRSDVPWRASSAMQLALARDAREGWPARPISRWLDDVFRSLLPRGLSVKGLPAAHGGATFLRAATTWGMTWKAAATPRAMPFALARDPYSIRAHRFGFAIAHAVAEPAFQRRALELPSRIAASQSRVLRATELLHARTLAARVVLGASEHVDAALFEETTLRAFGAPLPSSLLNAWPAPRIDDPTRLLALLGTPAFVKSLVERYDDDWFRNPKAGTHLMGLAVGPAFDPEPPPEGAARSIGAWFEEVLG